MGEWSLNPQGIRGPRCQGISVPPPRRTPFGFVLSSGNADKGLKKMARLGQHVVFARCGLVWTFTAASARPHSGLPPLKETRMVQKLHYADEHGRWNNLEKHERRTLTFICLGRKPELLNIMHSYLQRKLKKQCLIACLSHSSLSLCGFC